MRHEITPVEAKPTVNVLNVDLVARAIETYAVPNLGFNMSDVVHDASFLPDVDGYSCGTTACIAGWTLALLDKESFAIAARPDWPIDVVDIAQNILGLDDDQADALFHPHGYWIANGALYPQKSAVRVLDILRDEGVVDWPRALASA